MRQPQRHLQGFTLIELMIAISVAAILIGVGIPGMWGMIQDNRRAATVNALVSDFRQARMAAFSRNLPVWICVSDNPSFPSFCDTSGSWADGWFIFVDANDNGARDAGEAVLKSHGVAPTGVEVSANFTDRRFTRNGGGSTGTISVCANGKKRDIILELTGHLRLESDSC